MFDSKVIMLRCFALWTPASHVWHFDDALCTSARHLFLLLLGDRDMVHTAVELSDPKWIINQGMR